MPRRAQVSVENNFTRGYITEATGLNFPANAATAMQNCVVDHRGVVSRRLGADFETDYQEKNIAKETSVMSTFVWKDAVGDGTVSFVLCQVGELLHIYNVASAASLSAGEHATEIDLTTFSPAGAVSPAENECQYTEGLNSVIVTHPFLEPFRIEYSASGNSFSTTQITVEMRDFRGVADTLALTDRPTYTVASMEAHATGVLHAYNLYNQGWEFNKGSSGPIDDWDTARSDMPSNVDVWWAYKNSSGDWANAQLARVDLGNTPAAKGHYILDVFNPDRDTVSGLSGVTDPYAAGTNRFATCVWFAGRVWYAGLNYTGLSSNIYFSQIVERDEQLGQCYQSNDPTSETNPELLPSDGGTITIQDGGLVIKMIPFQESLLVFTTKGIWAIAGSEGIGFTANDYSIRKISSVPSLSHTSFVTSRGAPAWWNSDGIYTISGDTIAGIEVQSLTDLTIKSFFSDIPLASKGLARGAFNRVENRIHWLYRTTTAADPDDAYVFDAVLTLNTLTGAFSPWYVPTSDVEVHGVVVVEIETSTFSTVTVVDDAADTVVVDAGDTVVIFDESNSLVGSVFKYWVSTEAASNHDFTFAEFFDLSYVDWSTEVSGGTDYTSSFTTGYRLEGDTQRFFQSNYVFVFLNQETVSGSCFMRGIFDFATNGNSGKYSSSQQIYNSAIENQSVNFRKLKLRGKGRSIQLNFESASGQPFSIIGWSTFDTVNESI